MWSETEHIHQGGPDKAHTHISIFYFAVLKAEFCSLSSDFLERTIIHVQAQCSRETN